MTSKEYQDRQRQRSAAEVDRDFPRVDQPPTIDASEPIAAPDDAAIPFAALLRAVPTGYDKVDVSFRFNRNNGMLTVIIHATRANTPAEYARLRDIMRAHGTELAIVAYDIWQAELATPLHYIADFDVMLGDTPIALVPDAPRNQPHTDRY